MKDVKFNLKFAIRNMQKEDNKLQREVAKSTLEAKKLIKMGNLDGEYYNTFYTMTNV